MTRCHRTFNPITRYRFRFEALFRLLFLVILLLPATAFAGPRDAVSVLNRCGNPLKGDTTIYENTVAGGRRVLTYERGTLNFDRVANSGWTFTYGGHATKDHLTAEQMEKYMPCLKDALAAADEPKPLVTYTPVMRAEVSVKRDYKMLVVVTCILLVLLGIGTFFWSRRDKEFESFDAPLD